MGIELRRTVMDAKSLYFGHISLLFASLMISCGGGSGESSSSNTNSHSESSSSGSPSSESFPLESFYNVENIYIEGDEIVIQTYDLPDHGSPYNYENGVYEGSVEEWIENGSHYLSKNYRNGKEDGIQKMWYQDGTLRANYEVRNNRR
jgi:antitoxin component YwqK of YwqJK toxin-antitoxin module